MDKDGRQIPIRVFSHSEEVIIQRTRVKVMDRNTGKVNAMYVLEGLGPYKISLKLRHWEGDLSNHIDTPTGVRYEIDTT